MKYILMQKKDFKSIELGKELQKYNVKLISVDGSPMKMPYYIIISLFKYGKPDAVIYRYLNDYPNIFKTMLRLLSELCGLLISFLIRTEIIWICHNVDRETNEFYPRITKFRRDIMTRCSKKILVTDPLLRRHAIYQFPKYKDKIDNITFGPFAIKDKVKRSGGLLENIKDFVNTTDKKTLNVKYGFVAGSINWKTAQYKEIPILMEKASENGTKIRMIVIGPIGNFLRKNDKELYLEFINNEDILFFDGFYNLDMTEISKFIDFYFRIYLDLSIPATIYESTYFKKPILTQEKGFLGEAVAKYSLGYVIKEDYSNLVNIFSEISNWNPSGARKFLETHTWKNGAEKIHEIILKDTPKK